MRGRRRRPIRRAQRDYLRMRTPIYVQRRRKNTGFSTCLVFFAILLIMGAFEFPGIAIFIVFIVMIQILRYSNSKSRSQKVYQAIEQKHPETLGDIAQQTGLNEDDIREKILEGRKKGILNIRFDPATGRILKVDEVTPTSQPEEKRVCEYCGFVLKPEDRFCPYCGAPIKG